MVSGINDERGDSEESAHLADLLLLIPDIIQRIVAIQVVPDIVAFRPLVLIDLEVPPKFIVCEHVVGDVIFSRLVLTE